MDKVYTVNEMVEKLKSGEVEDFNYQYQENQCYAYISLGGFEDDVELCFQLENGKLSDKIIERSISVLENCIKHKNTAVNSLKQCISDSEYWLWGIYFGKYQYGGHGADLYFDGFTMTLKKVSNDYDEYSLLYTVKMKADGWPVGEERWIE